MLTSMLNYKCQPQVMQGLEIVIPSYGMLSHVNADEYEMIKNVNLGVTERLELPIS
jgi:hypothetical protein